MSLPRTVHKAYANFAGYFWLPCPVCERMFGGHERPQGYLQTGSYSGLVVCANCIGEAKRINEERWRYLA